MAWSSLRAWGCAYNYVANLGGMFTIAGQGPVIDIMSLFTVDSKHLYCWQEDAPKIGLLSFNVWHGGDPDGTKDAGAGPKAVVSIIGPAIKQTHLVPDSMTTLASLIPLGIRSLMTSRMIRDPMKVYSADNKCTHQMVGSIGQNRDQSCLPTTKRGTDFTFSLGTKERKSWQIGGHILVFAVLSLSLSLPCRGRGGGVGEGPVPLQTSLEQYGMNL